MFSFQWFAIFALVGGFLLSIVEAVFAGQPQQMYPELATYIEQRTSEFDQIPDERKAQLGELAAFVRENAKAGKPSKLTFVCTHNSRRSQFSQVWAAVAAAQFGVADVQTFSGGTEATAFNPRAVKALENAGLRIEAITETKNPVYTVGYGHDAPALRCSSKVYNESPNPKENFCAVMTCAQADKSCPTVYGATKRVAITYEDPKAFDGKPQEAEKYNERCAQIAREMLYAFSQVAQ